MSKECHYLQGSHKCCHTIDAIAMHPEGRHSNLHYYAVVVIAYTTYIPNTTSLDPNVHYTKLALEWDHDNPGFQVLYSVMD